MNWPRRLPLVFPAICAWPALSFSAEATSLHAQLMIFSGRPDPAFVISEPAVIRQVVDTLAALPRHPTLTAEDSVAPPQLGYRGFSVTPTGMDGIARFAVYGTAVEVTAAGSGVETKTFRLDRNASLERLLFSVGRAQGAIAGEQPGATSNTGASVVDRSVTIHLGNQVASLVPMPKRDPFTVRPGTRLKLVATQAGETAADVTWVKDSRALAATGRVLEIAGASPADSGLYWAVVGTGNGQSQTSAQAEILVTGRAGQRFLNLSVLGQIGVEHPVLTAGFTIESAAVGSRTLVLVRAIGPALGPFAVGAVVRAPQLQLIDARGAVVPPANMPFALPSVAVATERTGAFPLPANSADDAQLYYLAGGGYTANASSIDGGTGVVLIEVFEVALN